MKQETRQLAFMFAVGIGVFLVVILAITWASAA